MSHPQAESSEGDGRALAAIKKILDYDMTIAEWIGLAAILAAPYLVVGVLWSITRADNLGILWFVKSTLTWPWLMFSGVLCLTW